MKALRDIYKLNINEPFNQLFTQGMITHKTYKTNNNDWVMPKDIAIVDGKLVHIKTKESITEGPSEKMSKSKKNVVEPNEILKDFGIDATRIFMISDSPPDRELEWTDEGIQSSKNLINRIDRYFQNQSTIIKENAIKNIEKFIYEIEKNILEFALNKCVASIYTLFNYLEKNKFYLSNNELSKKILICLYPITPDLVKKIFSFLYNEEFKNHSWPTINSKLLEENELIIPIQVKGKLVTTIKAPKDYDEKSILGEILKIDKVNNKIQNKKIIKIINVQNKIINIITS